MRLLLLTLLFVLCAFAVSGQKSIQSPEVKFYPYGGLTICKGCGHWHTDYWRLKYRLENISGKDLIVYVQRLGDDVDFIHEVQYRNPNLCQWEYGYGESERRVPWSKLSSYEKFPVRLKPGESLESERGIGGYAWGGSTDVATRWVTWVATDPNVEPIEVFSDPIVEVGKGKHIDSDEPAYRVVDNSCSPQCRLKNGESPEVRGIRLGTTLKEFQTKFPKSKVSRLHKDLYNYKMAVVWDFDEDAYSVDFIFLDDKVESIEAQFKSLKNKREQADFWELAAAKIGIPYWPFYHGGWQCHGISIEVLTNIEPTIYIRSDKYVKVRDRLNEIYLQKLKLPK